MEFALQLNFTPTVDAQKLNVMIAALKDSLGALGKDIKLIDADKLNEQLKKTKGGLSGVDDAARKTERSMKGAGDPQNIAKLAPVLSKISSGFSDIGKTAAGVFAGGILTSGASGVVDGLQKVIDIGSSYQSSLADLKAITGVADDQLGKMGASARGLAKEFGGDATGQIDSYKTILSKLGPGIGNSPEALEKMGRAVATLSAATGDSNAASVDALTTGLLQFNVALDDPVAAAEEMTKQMNIMAAAAQQGAAEVPRVAEALKVAGTAAYGSNVAFEETNALIQVLAAGGKEGAEGGTALRNVMSKLAEGRFLPKDTQKELLAANVDINRLSDKSLSFTDRLRELQKIQADGALVTKLFGSENAAAANILLRNVDAVDELTEKISGTNTATEQAAIRQQTFAAAMQRLQAFASDVAISLFEAGKGVFQFIAPIAEELAPVLTALAPIVGVIVGAFVVYTNATKIAAAAQLAFNAVLSANPIGAVIVTVVALIAGIKALSSALHETAEEQLESAQAEGKLLEAQKESNLETQKRIKSSVALGEEYKALANKSNRTAAEEKKLQDISLKLNNQYPGLIANTKDFTSNLANIDKQAELSKSRLGELSSELNKLNERIKANAREQAYLVRNVAGQEVENALTDAFLSSANVIAKGTGRVAEFLFNTSTARQTAETMIGAFKSAIYKATTSTEVTDALLNFQDKINASTDINAEGKLSVFAAAQKFANEQSNILAASTKSNEVATTEVVKEESGKRVAVDKKEKKEKTKTLFETLKERFAVEDSTTKRQIKNLELSEEERILSEGRQRTLEDEKGLEEEKLSRLQQLKVKFQELFKVVDVGPVGIKLETPNEQTAVNEMIDDVNQAVQEAQNRVQAITLKIDTKTAEESVKETEELFKKRLQGLRSSNEQELLNLESNISNQSRFSEKVFSTLTERFSESNRERTSLKIKEIDRLKEQQIITEEQYNARRQEIESVASKRELATRYQFEGQRLEIERQSEVKRLELKKVQTIKELELLQRAGKDDEAAQVEERLDSILASLERKSDPLIDAGARIQEGLSDVFSNIGVFNLEGAKDSFRQLFSIIAGGLSRLASAYVLETLFTTVPTTGILGLVAVPALKGLIESSINIILNPILGGLASFATGGIVTSPTVAVVGDVPGPNKSEAILNSEMMVLSLQAAMSTYEGRLIGEVRGMREDIRNFSGRLHVLESDVYSGYGSYSNQVNRRGRVSP